MTSITQTQLEALRQIQKTIGAANEAKGFHDYGNDLRLVVNNTTRYEGKGPTLTDQALRTYYGEKLLLIVSEVTEAHDELRAGRAIDETYYPGAITPSSDKNAPFMIHKPEGIPSELADVVIRVFDLADEAGIDLAGIIDEKLRYNATRPRLHGKKF